jgi:hypothetical protein
LNGYPTRTPKELRNAAGKLEVSETDALAHDVTAAAERKRAEERAEQDKKHREEELVSPRRARAARLLTSLRGAAPQAKMGIRPGKGTASDYALFCRGCHLEYTLLDHTRCVHCSSGPAGAALRAATDRCTQPRCSRGQSGRPSLPRRCRS